MKISNVYNLCARWLEYLKVNSSERYVCTTWFNSVKSSSVAHGTKTHSALLLEFCVRNNNANESYTKFKRKRQHIFECKTKIFKWTKIFTRTCESRIRSKEKKSGGNKYTRKNAEPLVLIKAYTVLCIVYTLHSQIINSNFVYF